MSVDSHAIAVVIGARGGIGHALAEQIQRDGAFAQVVRLHRPQFDLTNEASIAAAAAALPTGDLRLVINAAGILHNGAYQPEKNLRQLDGEWLARTFAVNAIGPALVFKHFLPRLPREGRAVVATLSARVGSIGDNRLGGWYGYRASKAAVNQFVRTAAIELRRTHPDALCVALHPGTVRTGLSAPFTQAGQELHAPEVAARHLLAVIEKLTADDNGSFYDWRGNPIEW
jgi:NAD(P)-dependent dehydrogenase (short-subunit alcohol dehydrogenase family)